jgi:hypothetical protein
MNWTSDDSNERWIYRTIYPNEINVANKILTQFKNMQEMDAEADWNYDEHIEDPDNIPLQMSQKTISTEVFQMGLSFFAFANYHQSVVIVQDLPMVAEIGDNFAIIVEGNTNVQNSMAYRQFMQRRSQPRKIRNTANEEVTLKTFICYKANSDRLVAGSQFSIIWDSNRMNHRYVAPAANVFIGCTDCIIGGRLGAEPNGAQPSLFSLLDLKIHCFRMRAAAQPTAFCSHFDGDVHRLACILYRGFDTECCEEDSKNIIAILRFLNLTNYKVDSLKLIKKQCVIDLLTVLFMSEYLDEEETKSVESILFWVRKEFDYRVVNNSREQQVVSGVTKVQISLHYEVECSDEALDTINMSFEHHFISTTIAMVPKYKVMNCDSSYVVVVIDFACEYVPIHLIDFPVVEFNGRQLIPTDPMIVSDAIVEPRQTNALHA